MRVKILSDAEKDLLEGFYFYERQQTSLGREFFEYLESEILYLPTVCGIHPKQFGYHRAVVRKRFPFAIFYRYDSDFIYVHAVFDCRSDPSEIESRLQGK